MRIAELSRTTGTPVPTIKYYLREGLLPPGELTSPNQARYGTQHVRRLRLIRALTELGKVPIAQVRDILAGLDDPTRPLHEQIGRAHRAITRHPPATAQDSGEQAAHQVQELLTARGWQVEPDAPALTTLTETIATLNTLGQSRLTTFLDAYAEAVERVTTLELNAVTPPDATPDQIAESVVLGTILGETLLTSLRLLAQEAHSATRWTRPAAD